MTGSKSHKLVTSDVSRILWFYYNDPVRCPHLTRIPVSHPPPILDNTLPHLCRKRTLLRFPLPCSLGNCADFTPQLHFSSPVGEPYLARTYRSDLLPRLRVKKYYQHCPAVEGFQDPGRSGSGREGKGEGTGEGDQGLKPRRGTFKYYYCSHSVDSSSGLSELGALPSEYIITYEPWKRTYATISTSLLFPGWTYEED